MVQTIITAVIVLAAAAYVARYFWRVTHSQTTGCGCDNPQCEKRPQ